MAEPLSAERESGNLTRASFLEFVERHDAIEEEIADAQETMRSIRRRRKDLRKTIEAEGHNIDEFDRALRDAKRSGEEREAADRAYRRNMAWLAKPVGYQTEFDITPAAMAGAEAHEVKRAEREGFKAGKDGDRADRNPWRPGSEPFAAWHSSWLRGQAEKVTAEIQPTEPKRRGRPPRSKNKAAPNGVDRGDVPLPLAHGDDAGAPSNLVARATGFGDGLAGHMDHAARWPAGEPGHGDYELGRAEGLDKRHGEDNAPTQGV